jgi:hypothetical protein
MCWRLREKAEMLEKLSMDYLSVRRDDSDPESFFTDEKDLEHPACFNFKLNHLEAKYL